jgi:predicted nuclease with TOPRIM domain
LFTKYKAKKNNSAQAQLPHAQVLGELVLEPINKALQEENGNLKAENRVLKEREICKQELMDEYKARAKNVEGENQRTKEEIQRFRDEVSSLKEKEAALKVEIEYLKRREEEMRVERNADRAMLQSMISNLMNGIDDRKRKRNDNSDETK